METEYTAQEIVYSPPFQYRASVEPEVSFDLIAQQDAALETDALDIYCRELLRERDALLDDTELYLEHALQDIQQSYATPEYYLTVVKTWLILESKSTLDLAVHAAGMSFLHRHLTPSGRRFALTLIQLVKSSSPKHIRLNNEGDKN